MSSNSTLNKGTTLAYCLGDVANNFVNLLISSFLLIFYTDVFGISPIAAATLFLVARAWDAINDPIIGILIDKTNTRWGRFRPWVMFSAIPCAVFCIAAFTVPMEDMSEAAKLIYAYVTYIGFGMAYTAVNVPYLSMLTVLTEDSTERTRLVAFRSLLVAIPMILMSLVPAILEAIGYKIGFQIISIAFSLIALALWFICVVKCKERIDLNKTQDSEDKPQIGLMQIIHYLKNNKPFLLLCLMIALQFAYQAVTAGSGMYIAIYYLKMPELMTPMMLAAIFPAILGVMIGRKLVLKHDKKWIFIIGMLFASIRSPFILTMDPTTIIITAAIAATFQGMAMGFTWSFLPDCIEYGELKTGLRLDGLSTAIVGFFYKMGFALGGALPGTILGMYGYVANQEQTSEALFGMEILGVYMPVLLAIAGGLIMVPYSITREKQQETIEKLHKVRAGNRRIEEPTSTVIANA